MCFANKYNIVRRLDRWNNNTLMMEFGYFCRNKCIVKHWFMSVGHGSAELQNTFPYQRNHRFYPSRKCNNLYALLSCPVSCKLFNRIKGYLWFLFSSKRPRFPIYMARRKGVSEFDIVNCIYVVSWLLTNSEDWLQMRGLNVKSSVFRFCNMVL